MKSSRILSIALLPALGVCSLAAGQSAAPVSSAQRSLTIPIGPAEPGAKAPAVECVAACGTAIPLSAAAFSPDNKTLAVGAYKEVLLWDLVEGKLAKRIGAGQIGTMVRSVLFSKDGKTLAAAEGTVRIFDLQTGQPTLNFQEPKGAVCCLALSPDGKLLVGGCGDAAAYVWSLEEKKLVTTLKGHSLSVVSVSFSADGKFLATASLDKTVRTWDTTAWDPGRNKTTLEAPVRRCFIRSARGKSTSSAPRRPR